MEATDEYPLISAISIIKRSDVCNLPRLIKSFKLQTYPYKELVIVNNAKNQFEASGVNIDAEPDVFLVDTPHQLVAGHARNYGISASNGRILAQFDADCWHSSKRLETQVSAMAQNSAHISILSRALQYSHNSKRACYATNKKSAILNSMMFIRPSNIDYPPAEKNEELGILNKMIQAGMQVVSMDNPELICKIFGKPDKTDDIQSQVTLDHLASVKSILSKSEV